MTTRGTLLALVAAAYLMQISQPATSEPVGIDASLGGQSFAFRELLPLRLVIHNLSAAPLSVPVPTSTIQIHLRLPSGKETSINLADALQEPGVPNIPGSVSVPAHSDRQFEWDVAKLANLDKPGAYSLRVEYAWKTGTTWRSADLPFNLAKPAPKFLTVTPSEASRGGYHTAIWAEQAGDAERVLASEFRIQDANPRIEGAREISRVPLEAAPALSMEPPQKPFPGRWMAWIRQGRFYSLYDAQTPADRTAPNSVSLATANVTLIDPLLANQPPDQGRPGFAAGIVLRGTEGTQFQLVEVDRNGQARLSPVMSVPGDLIQGWATALDAASRVFVLALQTQNQIQIVETVCPKGRACSTPFTLLRTDGELLGSDIRPGPARQLFVGLLLKQGAGWKRLTLARSASGVASAPAETSLSACGGATTIKARLDQGGQLGVAYLCNQQLLYVPPEGNAATEIGKSLAGQVKFFDFTFRPNLPPAFLLYSAQTGPEFAAIP